MAWPWTDLDLDLSLTIVTLPEAWICENLSNLGDPIIHKLRNYLLIYLMLGPATGCWGGRGGGPGAGAGQYSGVCGQEGGSHRPLQGPRAGSTEADGLLSNQNRPLWELQEVKILRCIQISEINILFFSFYKNLFGLSPEAEKLDQVSD